MQQDMLFHIGRKATSPIRNHNKQYEPIRAPHNTDSTVKETQQQQRRQMIKGKIKSRISNILKSGCNIQKEKPHKHQEDWRRDGEFSVQQIISKHNMNSLRRKYMEYLEKGMQSTNEVRIGGAAKLHIPLNSQLGIQNFMAQVELRCAGKEYRDNKRHRQSRYSCSKISHPRESLFNVRQILSMCKVSPVKLENRPFTAENGSERYITKRAAGDEVDIWKHQPSHKHLRYSSYTQDQYFFGTLRKKRQTMNTQQLRAMAQKQHFRTPPKLNPNDIRPWQLEEDTLLDA